MPKQGSPKLSLDIRDIFGKNLNLAEMKQLPTFFSVLQSLSISLLAQV